MIKRGIVGDKVRGWQKVNYIRPWTWMLCVMGPSKGFKQRSDVESGLLFRGIPVAVVSG